MKKTNKRKSIFLLSAILGSVALVSAGFAAWVITGDDAVETEAGTIVVEDVSNKSIEISYNWTTSNEIVFGTTTKDDTATNSWLKNESTKTQNLEATLSITVSNYDMLDSFAIGFKAVAAENSGITDEEATTKWSNAVTAEYVVAPEIPQTFAWNVNEETNTATYSLNLVFKWGAHFGGINPINYYNAHKKTDVIPETETTYAADAETSLSTLYDYLENVSYKITLNATAK